MSLSDFLSRVYNYLHRNGMRPTFGRIWVGLLRARLAGQKVIFTCDVDHRILPPESHPDSPRVEPVETLSELGANRFGRMTTFWNPKLAERNIRERFAKGATLWLVMTGDELAGYGWTLQGRTIEPYFFPLAQNDVHLFDFHVFPAFRGRGFNPFLVGSILRALVHGGLRRAFIEAAAWNNAQLTSLRKTPFRRLGAARLFRILNCSFVVWAREKPQRWHTEPIDGMVHSTSTDNGTVAR